MSIYPTEVGAHFVFEVEELESNIDGLTKSEECLYLDLTTSWAPTILRASRTSK